jgi:NADH:ubiquinone oxidoreductase subunit 5 (subunit L)/multisubunit Na+/H+ antiporter MnhA subunit
MPLRTLLFVVGLAVIGLGAYLLLKLKGRESKTTIRIANVGELSTTSVGLVTIAVGVVLAYFSAQANEKSEAVTQVLQTRERQTAPRAVPPASSVSVSQSSTGDGSPNIINGGSVTLQVDKSRNDR